MEKFSTPIKSLAVGALVLFDVSLFQSCDATKAELPEEALMNYNYVIGTQTVGAKYKFSKETDLVETAQQILDMGSNLMKFSMHPRYCTENYDLPENKDIKSLTDLAILEPSMNKVLNMDFKYYHIWVYGFSQYSPEPMGEKNDTTQIKFIGGYPESYETALYTELYDFTKHLLTTYQGSGKAFYLGHWEGDWHLRWHYDRTKAVDVETLTGMIKWEKIRQKAIDDAKIDFPPKGIEVYNYIEVNLVRAGIENPDKLTVTNSIISEVNPDFVSYSSYDATNPYKNEADLNKALSESLDYIASKLTPKENLPQGKRVWIGEYGSPAISYNQVDQDNRSKWVIKTGLEWGTPFILYWEMYNNEIKADTQEHVGYWLIDDKGEKQKIWYTHYDFYEETKQYLEAYYQENKQMPNQAEFYKEALQFNSLKTSDKLVTANTH
ncbi:MAG: hypothetical protein ACJAVY_000276 [Marinoscillum sp.]|jgi:hypothetical protein